MMCAIGAVIFLFYVIIHITFYDLCFQIGITCPPDESDHICIFGGPVKLLPPQDCSSLNKLLVYLGL